MKRKLSLVMAFMMAATLVPAIPANADTKNSIDRTISATSDMKIGNWNEKEGKFENLTHLRINDDNGTKTGLKAGKYFELELDGDCKWLFSGERKTSGGSSTSADDLDELKSNLDTAIANLNDIYQTGEPNNVNKSKWLNNGLRVYKNGAFTVDNIDNVTNANIKAVDDDTNVKKIGGESFGDIFVAGAGSDVELAPNLSDADNFLDDLKGQFGAASNKVTANGVAKSIGETIAHPVNTAGLENDCTKVLDNVTKYETAIKELEAKQKDVDKLIGIFERVEKLTDNDSGVSTGKAKAQAKLIIKGLNGVRGELQTQINNANDYINTVKKANEAYDAYRNAYSAYNGGSTTSSTSTSISPDSTYGTFFTAQGKITTQGAANHVFTILRESDRTIRVEIEKDATEILVPICVDLNGTKAGAAKVTIIPKDSSVSASKNDLTFATVSNDDIKLSVEKKEKFARTGDNKVTIKLEEVTMNSFKDADEVILRLPKYFKWNGNKDNGTKVTGAKFEILSEGRDLRIYSFTDTSQLDTVFIEAKIDVERDARLGDVEVTVKKGNVDPDFITIGEYVDHLIDIKAKNVLEVIAGKDVEGKYVATVEIEEVVPNALLNNRYLEVSFNKEQASLQDGEILKIKKLGGDSKADLEIDGSSNDVLVDIDGSRNKDIQISDAKGHKGSGDAFDLKVIQNTKETKGKYELKIPFVVSGDFTGDLMLNFKGAGVEGDAKNGGVDVKIANVKAPVTVDVVKPLPEVKIGLQRQKGSDIIIKETEAGALQDYVPNNGVGSTGETLEYVGAGNGSYDINGDPKRNGEYRKVRTVNSKNNRRPGSGQDYAEYAIQTKEKNFGLTFKDCDFAVVDGDISLEDNKCDINSQTKDGFKNKLTIAVDRKSTKASTIKLSGITATLDRTVPYGEIKLDAKFGVVEKRHNDDDITDKTVKNIPYFTTVTPVSDDKRMTTVFTIGSKDYEVVTGTEVSKVTMDVAPFAENGVTYLPLRYVGNALGANVSFDENARQAILTRNNQTVTIQLDERATINGKKFGVIHDGSAIQYFELVGGQIPAVEGRIMLPIRKLAEVFHLGDSIVWDAAHPELVTLLPQDFTKEEMEAAKAGKVVENVKKDVVKAEVKEEVKEEKAEKKADEKKADEKKADEKKADEKKAEDK